MLSDKSLKPKPKRLKRSKKPNKTDPRLKETTELLEKLMTSVDLEVENVAVLEEEEAREEAVVDTEVGTEGVIEVREVDIVEEAEEEVEIDNTDLRLPEKVKKVMLEDSTMTKKKELTLTSNTTIDLTDTREREDKLILTHMTEDPALEEVTNSRKVVTEEETGVMRSRWSTKRREKMLRLSKKKPKPLLKSVRNKPKKPERATEEEKEEEEEEREEVEEETEEVEEAEEVEETSTEVREKTEEKEDLTKILTTSLMRRMLRIKTI